jgi:hypothetical protein
MTLTLFLLIVTFLIGLYYYAKCDSFKYTFSEGFVSNENENANARCPNLLIQKGSRFYLYNTRLIKVPGVNPIEFDNLEDYTEFLDWQRSQNIRCPVLFLQETYDTQGKRVFKTRPCVFEPQAGLNPSVASSASNTIYESDLILNNLDGYTNPTLLVDATRNDKPYNENSYPAYDQTDYYVGTTTPLDMMDVQEEAEYVSPNAMNPNWGGEKYTEELVDSGYYADREVKMY